MRIASSDITLTSTYQVATQRSRRETLTVTSRPTASAPPATSTRPAAVDTANASDDTGLDPKLLLIKLVVESLTGQDIHVMRADALTPKTPAPTLATTATPATTQPAWGVSYQASETVTESQQLGVTAQGVVQTADGQTIPFTLSLALSDARQSTQTTSFRAGNAAVDPLVIHFDGPADALTGGRVTFDLNADGRTEAMPFTGPGSGFLALDRDGNGRVTDGRELFGPTTGDGFSELSALDGDGNGWLDAADSAFAALRVWSQDATGQQTLSPLASHGVGALYLANVGAAFSFTDAAATPLGESRAAGLYLTEDGRPGALQQIDLHV